MNLAELANLANSRSGFLRPTQVYAALTAASRKIYLRILQENRGMFIKWDTTTVAMAVGTEEYTLPADCRQLLRVRERVSANEKWRIIRVAETVNDEDLLDLDFEDTIGTDDGPVSNFMYFGPYLKAAAAAAATQLYSIRFGPVPQDVRLVELVYPANFVEIHKDSDTFTIPEEGHDALLDFATAELCRGKTPERCREYTEEGEAKLVTFLQWVRNRQMQQGRKQRAYL
jgi:hypothetical protein